MGVDPYPGAAKAGWMAGPGVASVERRLDRGNLASSRRILPAPMMTGTTRLIPRSSRWTSEAIPEYWRQPHCRCGAIWSTIRSEEHTSELQSLMRISYAVFCLKKKKQDNNQYLYSTKHP